jgi:hypothetical protein
MLSLRSVTADDVGRPESGIGAAPSIQVGFRLVERLAGVGDGARAPKTRSDTARLPFCRADAMSKVGTRDHRRHGGAHRRPKHLARG